VARGPKASAALKELGVPVTVAVPEPNTWRDLLRALDEKAGSLPLKGREWRFRNTAHPTRNYGGTFGSRRARNACARVRMGLPEDVGPLRAAVATIASDEFDVVLFTTAIQVNHLFQSRLK